MGLRTPARLGQRAGLLWQLRAALGFELTARPPRAVDLADRVPAGKGDDGRDEREYKSADRDDDLEHDDDGDDSCDYDNGCSHDADYRARLRAER
jgi:hypothetical protein